MNIISAKLRCLHPTSVWLPLSEGWGASCPGWFILPPRLGFVSGSVISQFLLHHSLGIFSSKRYKHYFSQTEMFTSNVQFGTLVWGVGGKLSRLVYLAPHQGFGSNSVINSFLLNHYLEIFSCNYSWTLFQPNWDVYIQHQFGYPCPRGRGKLSRLVYLAPLPRIRVKQCHQLILIVP